MNVNYLSANDACMHHKWFHLLENDSSLRKCSKGVKITNYVEQILGKKIHGVLACPLG